MKENRQLNSTIVSVLANCGSNISAMITNVFEKNGIGVIKLAVGTAERKDLVRITAVTDCSAEEISSSVEELRTVSDIHSIKVLNENDRVTRELVLIKVSATSDTRSEIVEIVNIFRGKIIDLAPSSVIIEITGEDDKTEALLNMLDKFGIIETARTGTVALERGAANIYE